VGLARSKYVAHAVFMCIGWGLLLPMGVIVARFGKGRGKAKSQGGGGGGWGRHGGATGTLVPGTPRRASDRSGAGARRFRDGAADGWRRGGGGTSPVRMQHTSKSG
jgi:hypothetical protein